MRKLLVAVYRTGRRIVRGRGATRFHFVGVLDRFIVSHLKGSAAEVLGHRMYLDSYDSQWLSIYGVHEPFTTEIVSAEVRRGDVVVDLGAFIGYYTLMFARLVGDEGKVLALEPHPGNCALLRKNLEVNGYKNVVVMQKAVADRSENGRLYLGNNPSVHGIYDFGNARGWVETEVVRLDDCVEAWGVGHVDLIKMDIEGAEERALEGMGGVLGRNRRVKVVTEFYPRLLRASGTDGGQYLRRLVGRGFRIYDINERKRELRAVDVEELLALYPPRKGCYTNLLCVRE